MIHLAKYQGKKIGIIGLGITGRAVFTALKQVTPFLLCYDDNHNTRLEFVHVAGEAMQDLAFQAWQHLDYIIISPGVPHDHPGFALARKHNITVLNDIELLYSQLPDAKYMAVTGTNGKSTTISLLAHILEGCLPVAVGGNIGTPSLSLSEQAHYLLELSSFQLWGVKTFKADVAILLNISPHHQDVHPTIYHYIAAKLAIFNNFDANSSAIIGVDDMHSELIYMQLKTSLPGKCIPISNKRKLAYGVSVIDQVLYDHLNEEQPVVIDIPSDMALKGQHNMQNVAAAYVASRLWGVDHEHFIKCLRSFAPLAHRQQFVGYIGMLACYNDSKATNIEAASRSIMNLDDVLLLAGGLLKADNLEGLTPSLIKIRKAYLYGADKQKLGDFFQAKKIEYALFSDMDKAFQAAIVDHRTRESFGSNLLLAPACSSLDQFDNFERRGEHFIKLVNAAQ